MGSHQAWRKQRENSAASNQYPPGTILTFGDDTEEITNSKLQLVVGNYYYSNGTPKKIIRISTPSKGGTKRRKNKKSKRRKTYRRRV